MSDRRTAATFLADLELAVANIEAIQRRLLAEIQEHGTKFTPVQEAKWEGAFTLVRGVLSDELHPMLRAWQDGGVSSRKSELILEGVDTSGMPTRTIVLGPDTPETT